MELLNFNQSLKLCIQLCEQLNAADLSQKIAKYISEKEQKDLMLESYKGPNGSAQNGRGGLENRRMLKTAMSSTDRPDLSSFAINSQAQPQNMNGKGKTVAEEPMIDTVQDYHVDHKSDSSQPTPTVKQVPQGVNPFAKKVATDLAKKSTHQ